MSATVFAAVMLLFCACLPVLRSPVAVSVQVLHQYIVSYRVVSQQELTHYHHWGLHLGLCIAPYALGLLLLVNLLSFNGPPAFSRV